MSLQIVVDKNGRRTVVHYAPHTRVDMTLIAPSFEEVVDALNFLNSTAPIKLQPSLSVIERFIRTR